MLVHSQIGSQSVSQSVSPPVSPPVCQSARQSVGRPISQSASQSVCQTVSWSVSQSSSQLESRPSGPFHSVESLAWDQQHRRTKAHCPGHVPPEPASYLHVLPGLSPQPRASVPYPLSPPLSLRTLPSLFTLEPPYPTLSPQPRASIPYPLSSP